jgi:hypothetical protein
MTALKYLVLLSLPVIIFGGCTTDGGCGPFSNVFNASLADTAFVELHSDSIWIFVDPNGHYHDFGDSVVYDIQNFADIKDSIRIISSIKGEHLFNSKIASEHTVQWTSDTLWYDVVYHSEKNTIVPTETKKAGAKKSDQTPQCSPFPETFILKEFHVAAPSGTKIMLIHY